MSLSAVHLERFGVRRRKSHTISGGTSSGAELTGIVFLVVSRRIDSVPSMVFNHLDDLHNSLQLTHNHAGQYRIHYQTLLPLCRVYTDQRDRRRLSRPDAQHIGYCCSRSVESVLHSTI